MTDRACRWCGRAARDEGCCLLCAVLAPNRVARHVVDPRACPDCRPRLAAVPAMIADAYPLLGQLLIPGAAPTSEIHVLAVEAPLPFSADIWDLSRSLRPIAVTGNLADQIGHLPVAVTLDGWVRDWIDLRALGETGPGPTVAGMARWLTERTDWACDEHPAVDEYADELQQLHGVLEARVGVIRDEAKPTPVKGVPCRRCDLATLAKLADGSANVECQNPSCRAIYRPDEYQRWVKLVAAAAR